MGRFYKTAKPEMLDFMFKVPEQAIMSAIKGADAQLEGQEAYLTELQKQLKTAALDEDEERRKARVAELEGKIREHSLNIWENPLAAIKEQRKIKDLGQEIYKDLTEGELYAYNTNYNKRKAFEEKAIADATDKDGRLNVKQVTDAMTWFDTQYKLQQGAQFNKKTGKFNPYGTEELYNYVDRSKYAKETANGWESTKTKDWQSSSDGSYWWKVTNEKDVLGLDELTLGIRNTMIKDETITQPLLQNIKHQASTLAAIEFKKNGGDFNKLYKDEFNKLYEDYFGEIDPSTGQLALEEVLGKDGKPQINEETKKPVMRLKKPGKLYEEAYAAADKKDKNDITTGKEMTGADPYAMKTVELENAKKLEDYKNPVVTVDVETGEFIQTNFKGKTLEEAEQGLEEQASALTNSALDKKNQLLTLLSKDKNGNLKSQTELDKIRTQLDNLFPKIGATTTVKFNELKTYLATQGFTGDEEATGITTFQKQWESTNGDLINKRNLLQTMKQQSIETLSEDEKRKYNGKQAEIDKLEKEIQEGKKDLEAGQHRKYGSDKRTHENWILSRQMRIATIRKEQSIIVGNNLNLNPEDKGKNRNTQSFGVYKTTGTILQDYGVSDQKVRNLNLALKKMGDMNFFSVFGNASSQGTYIRNEGGTGMVPFNNTVLSKYFTDTKYAKEYDPVSKQMVIKDEDSKIVFEGRVGEYFVAIDDLDKVGQNAIATSIIGEQVINGKKEKVSFDLYTNQLGSNAINTALDDTRDELNYTAFVRKGERAAQHSGYDPRFVYQNPQGTIKFSQTSKGKGTLIFFDDNGNKITEVSSDSPQAISLYKKYK